jgi:iron complex outermembrane receptor protein
MVRRAILASLALGLAAAAQAEDLPPATPVEPLTVVAAAPLGGAGIDIDKTPANTQTLSGTDLLSGGAPDLIGALSDQLSSLSINDNLDDAFQPDILLRGFEASPVLGTPQGVAVYQSGVRINEAFGDTVNWDLLPDLAIRRVEVTGPNPVFGLNALGGAIALSLKDGFADRGADIALDGGSFGRREITGEFGANNGTAAVYLAGRGLDEDGWRQFSPDHLRQAYGDFAYHAAKVALDLSVTLADNRLYGESATPVQELAVNRALVFTNPQENDNRLAFVTLGGSFAASRTLSLQAVAYYRGFWQRVVNGNTTSYAACGRGANQGDLCQGDGLTVLTGGNGAAIPDISDGGALPIGEIDGEKIASTGAGGSLQAISTAEVLRRENHLTLGASLDTAVTDYSSNAEVGVIDANLSVQPTGLFVDTPQSSPFTATPVSLRASTVYGGLYMTDTFSPTARLAVTASARWNVARVDLADRLGTDLTGRNLYRRIDPAVGGAYRLAGWLTVYGGYSEGSRAPNPSEIECSNPQKPCLLPSSLASDPPTLRQVVSRTWEAGLRGRAQVAGGGFSWSAGLFRTDVRDDIYGVATSLSARYFQNIPGTRRQGVELSARYRRRGLTVFTSYSHIDATFQTDLAIPSPSNPLQDAAGNIAVHAGDRLPGIPRDRLKVGAELEARPGWTLGATFAFVGDQTYRGDEAGLLSPLPAYEVLSLHSTLNLGHRLSASVAVENALDARYATFGVLGDPTGVGAPGVPASDVGANPRFQSPAAPLSVHGGLKILF